MISEIKIENFQSHKKTELKLCSGVNTIVGSTDSGKSAVLRALYWLIENRPQGIAFASNWIKNEKGEIEDCVAVNVMNDSHSITRARDKSCNCYNLVNADNVGSPELKNFEKVSGNIPDEIQKILNITEVNIQKQMDSPFLLSNSSGEIARFFNSIVKLELIDYMLSSIESKKRQNKKETVQIENEISLAEKEIEKYNWISDAELYIEKFEKQEENKIKLLGELSSIKKMLQEFLYNQEVLQKLNFLDEVYFLIDDIEKVNQVIKDKKKSKYSIEELIASYEYKIKEIGEINEILDKKDIDKLIEEYSSINARFIESSNEVASLVKLVKDFEFNTKFIIHLDENIAGFLNELPELCPVCGNKMNL